MDNMMILGGEPERKTWYFDHDLCVRKVYRYLKSKDMNAGQEKELVPGLRTDAFAYDEKTRIRYICEIKVAWSDLPKSPSQVMDTVRPLRKRKKGDIVVPVIAFPLPLQKELRKDDRWNSFSATCRELGIEIWIIDSGAIRVVQRSKIRVPQAKVVKAKAAKPKTVKAKAVKTESIKTGERKKPTSKKNLAKKVTPKKTVAKKATPKKAVVKKATPKKVVAKKATPKKAVAKKATPKKAVAKKATTRKVR